MVVVGLVACGPLLFRNFKTWRRQSRYSTADNTSGASKQNQLAPVAGQGYGYGFGITEKKSLEKGDTAWNEKKELEAGQLGSYYTYDVEPIPPPLYTYESTVYQERHERPKSVREHQLLLYTALICLADRLIYLQPRHQPDMASQCRRCLPLVSHSILPLDTLINR